MQILRLKDVIEMTGLGRSTLYNMVRNGTFPASVALGERAVGWVSKEVEEWIEDRIRIRDQS